MNEARETEEIEDCMRESVSRAVAVRRIFLCDGTEESKEKFVKQVGFMFEERGKRKHKRTEIEIIVRLKKEI